MVRLWRVARLRLLSVGCGLFAAACLLGAGVLLGSARGQAQPQGPPEAPRASVPGSVTLPPGGRISFDHPAPAVPPGLPVVPAPIVIVENLADQPASVTDDGSRLRIDVDDGLILITNAGCAPDGGRLNQVTCPIQPVRFTTAPSDEALPLPLSQSVAPGETAVLIASAPSSLAGVAVLAVANRTAPESEPNGPPAAVTWDGATLLISAPPGRGLASAGPLCPRGDDGATMLSCAVTGTPPRLVEFTTVPLPPRQTPWQMLLAPGRADLPPGGAARFIHAASVAGAGAGLPPRGWDVVSYSDQPAGVADDGSSITISAAPGQIVIPNLTCAAVDSQASVVTCPLASISFTTAAIDAVAPLPQSATVVRGGVASLVAPASTPAAGAGAPAAVAIAWPFAASPYDGNGGDEPVASVSWDGESLEITPPDGYVVGPDSPDFRAIPPTVSPTPGGLVCERPGDLPTGIRCPLRGTPPRLVTFSAKDPTQPRLVHHQPPLFANIEIVSPAPEERSQLAVGQPVRFEAATARATRSGETTQTYIWDFGDGTAASGRSVSHAYAARGRYTVWLLVAGSTGGLEDQSLTVGVRQ